MAHWWPSRSGGFMPAPCSAFPMPPPCWNGTATCRRWPIWWPRPSMPTAGAPRRWRPANRTEAMSAPPEQRKDLLVECQRAFAAALAGGEASIAKTVIGDAIAAETRMQIHVDHVRGTLLDALAATFPVTRALVGEAFFAQTARAFLAH